MIPTRRFAMFRTAEQLHKTVRELMTGQAGAMTCMEEFLWTVYRTAVARLEHQGRPLHTR